MARPRSLFLNLDGIPAEATVDGPAVLRKVIYNSIKEGNVDMKTIDGIECFSKTIWYIVFKTKQARAAAKDTEIELHGQKFKLVSTEYERPRVTYTWVRLYGYPLDADPTYVEKTMQVYGELVSLTDDIDGRLQIKTGVKIAQFSSLKGNIPSFVHVGRHRVRTAYRGQVKTCRNCHQVGHEVKECTAGRVCKQCGQPGHTKGECPERICFQCMGKGHEIMNCPEYANSFPRLGEETHVNTDDNDQTVDNEPDFHPPDGDAWRTAAEREEAMYMDAQSSTEKAETQSDDTLNESSSNPATHSTGDTPQATPTAPNDSSMITDPTTTTAAPITEPTQPVPTTESTMPNTAENPAGTVFPPPLADTTDASSEEEEPPLKTLKTTKPSSTGDDKGESVEQEPGKMVTAKASSQGKKAKKKKESTLR